MDIKTKESALDLIHSAQHIALIGHHNPDGDAVGSVLGLMHYLRAFKEDVEAVVPTDFPEFLKWLDGCQDIHIATDDFPKVKAILMDADLIICLDFNQLSRVGDVSEILSESPAKKIMIDHHPNPVVEEFDLVISKTEVSSTAELVYECMDVWGTEFINNAVADALYVGIMTDTGSFSFNCNRPETYKITASLIEHGVDAAKVHRYVYDTYNESRLRLMGYCLYDKLTVLPEFRTAYISLTKEELERFDYQVGDTEGLVNYALSIKGVVMAVFMAEKKHKIRLSFRSKGDFAVNDIAHTYFEGGGHRNAAGGNSHESLDETIKKLIDVLPKYQQELKNTIV